MEQRRSIDDPMIWYVLIIAAIGMCVVAAAVVMATPARGRPGNDCGPVARGLIETRHDGVQVHGFGFLDHSDPRLRWSSDEWDYLCARRGPDIPTEILSVYRRAQAV